MRFFGRKRDTEQQPPAEVYVGVRQQLLRLTPAVEKELGEGRHGLSPLFYAGQDVITQIRLTQGG